MLAGCAYPAMMAMDLLRKAPAHPFLLERGVGVGSGVGGGDDNAPGKHILILGAGLAGMAAAYELGKLGYRCTLLEARDRAGEDAGVSEKARLIWRAGRPRRCKRRALTKVCISMPARRGSHIIMRSPCITARN